MDDMDSNLAELTTTIPVPRGRDRGERMTGLQVRRARKRIAREACAERWGIRHRYRFDGFWHHCVNCGHVS